MFVPPTCDKCFTKDASVGDELFPCCAFLRLKVSFTLDHCRDEVNMHHILVTRSKRMIGVNQALSELNSLPNVC